MWVAETTVHAEEVKIEAQNAADEEVSLKSLAPKHSPLIKTTGMFRISKQLNFKVIITHCTPNTLAWIAFLQTRPHTKFQWIIDVMQVGISLAAIHHTHTHTCSGKNK